MQAGQPLWRLWEGLQEVATPKASPTQGSTATLPTATKSSIQVCLLYHTNITGNFLWHGGSMWIIGVDLQHFVISYPGALG